MKYDFTSHIERKGHDAIAVEMLGQGGGFAVRGESKTEDSHRDDAEAEARHPLSETRQKRDGKNP